MTFCKKLILLCSILVLQLLALSGWGQRNGWEPITISDGLSQGMVYDMLQDKEGFIWIATKDGLNRFDGYQFKVFTHDPYSDNTIAGNTCTTLLQDFRGRIWIGTEKDGLSLYDPGSHQFFKATIRDKEAKDKGNQYIHRLRTDQSGNIWIFTLNPDKVYRIKPFAGLPDKKDFSELLTEEAGIADIGAVLPDKQSTVQSHAKAMLANTQHDFFTPSFLARASESRYLVDHNRRVWMMGMDTLFCRKNEVVRTIPVSSGPGMPVLNQFDDGTLVICNQDYLWLFKPDVLLNTEALTPENAYTRMPHPVRQANVFIRDNTGNIWAGTRGYGLIKLNPLFRQFGAKLKDYSPSFVIQDHKGRTYFHANYLPSYHFYKLDESSSRIEPLFPGLGGRYIGHDALIQDTQRKFWVLFDHRSESKRILRHYDEEWKLLGAYLLPPGDPFSDFSVRMTEDRLGRLWLGMSGGRLLRFDPASAQFKTFDYSAVLAESGVLTQTYSLYIDKGDCLWIATQKGLVRAVDFLSEPKFTVFRNSPTDRTSISNDFVTSVMDDPVFPGKYLWVATKGGGLERLDKQSGKFVHFTEKQGLPNKVVYGLLEGDDGNIWMSTNRGIACLNPRTLIFNNFNKLDGLQDDEFNTNSYSKTPAGELIFGGINGFNIFRASSIIRSNAKPLVRLIGLKVNNEELSAGEDGPLTSSIEYLPDLELRHDQNLITLEFGVMDFSNPVKSRFRYQLEGIDKNWVDAGTSHFANYAHLPPGSYRFRVVGTTNGDVWSDPVEIGITVVPPFYRTSFAYLLYLIAIVFLIHRWNKIQLNRVRLNEQLLYKEKEARRLAELDTLKTNFFTNISHEFRTPLSLLIGPLSDLAKKLPDDGMIPLMNRNLLRLQTLINQLLDLSKLEAGKMKPEIQQGDIAYFLDNFVSTFDSLTKSKGIVLESEISHPSMTAFFDRDKLEKILGNLLSNAIKFTPEGGLIQFEAKLTPVSDALTGALLQVRVSDNGIGIDAESLPRIFDRFYQADSSSRRGYEGTGVGLALVRELVTALKGEITVKSDPDSGTNFEVTLPCDRQTWAEYEIDVVAERETEAVPVLLTSSEALESGGLPILLVVEDNPDLRTYIRSIFESVCEVLEAADGQEGLEKAATEIPDLVICDLMMPVLDGFGFCKALKEDVNTNHIPVIMLTARAGLQDRLQGLTAGADDYLAKPFSPDELRLRVTNLLHQRKLLQEKYSAGAIHTASDAVEKPLTPDELFLKKTRTVMESNLSDSDFDVSRFADEMKMTPVQLRRKLKAITGQTVVEYIRNTRLEKAADLLRAKAGNVSEIAYMTGFESLPYFSKVFSEKYGEVPSGWR